MEQQRAPMQPTAVMAHWRAVREGVVQERPESAAVDAGALAADLVDPGILLVVCPATWRFFSGLWRDGFQSLSAAAHACRFPSGVVAICATRPSDAAKACR